MKAQSIFSSSRHFQRTTTSPDLQGWGAYLWSILLVFRSISQSRCLRGPACFHIPVFSCSHQLSPWVFCEESHSILSVELLFAQRLQIDFSVLDALFPKAPHFFFDACCCLLRLFYTCSQESKFTSFLPSEYYSTSPPLSRPLQTLTKTQEFCSLMWWPAWAWLWAPHFNWSNIVS